MELGTQATGIAVDAADAIAAIGKFARNFRANVMLMLGSGLSETAKAAKIRFEIPYGEIPGMAAPAVLGHPGKLLLGEWSGKSVAIFQGRLHLYEGHSWNRVTLPIRIADGLGVKTCVITNSSGGINRDFHPGQMVCIDDHINLMGSNALVGATVADHATMFTDMSAAYCPRLRKLLDESAANRKLSLAHGVYLAVSGPSYETPAEIRAFRNLGADIIGMSTVGEVLVARHLGMSCCGISCVSNHAAGVSDQPIHHEEVLAAGKANAKNLAALLDEFLNRI